MFLGSHNNCPQDVTDFTVTDGTPFSFSPNFDRALVATADVRYPPVNENSRFRFGIANDTHIIIFDHIISESLFRWRCVDGIDGQRRVAGGFDRRSNVIFTNRFRIRIGFKPFFIPLGGFRAPF